PAKYLPGPNKNVLSRLTARREHPPRVDICLPIEDIIADSDKRDNRQIPRRSRALPPGPAPFRRGGRRARAADAWCGRPFLGRPLILPLFFPAEGPPEDAPLAPV